MKVTRIVMKLEPCQPVQFFPPIADSDPPNLAGTSSWTLPVGRSHPRQPPTSYEDLATENKKHFNFNCNSYKNYKKRNFGSTIA